MITFYSRANNGNDNHNNDHDNHYHNNDHDDRDEPNNCGDPSDNHLLQLVIFVFLHQVGDHLEMIRLFKKYPQNHDPLHHHHHHHHHQHPS